MNLHADSLVIDLLGGPTAVAAMFEIAPQAVSQWRRSGIPKARRMYLELSAPHAFAQSKPTIVARLQEVERAA